MGNIDREYSLSDLIETGMLDELFEEVRKTTPTDFHLLTEERDIVYSIGSMADDEKQSCIKCLEKLRADRPCRAHGKERDIIIFPIRHEHEEKGYLVLLYEKGSKFSKNRYVFIGSLLAKLISQHIRLKYRQLMIEDIHGRVVEDSYANLRHKTVKLEESEKKYRQLAGTLEEEVRKQTEKIKSAQSRLFQNEKLTSVGRIAAGFAHEINNPIGFVQSNLCTMEEYVSDLHKLFDAVRDLETFFKETGTQSIDSGGLSRAFRQVERIKKQIDLDFILNDFASVLSESKEGTKRVGKIVSDLKEFSSIDNPGKTYTDINECIDNTVNVVAGAFQSNVTVEKDFGNIPQVLCRRDKINQLLLNILYNAWDAAGSNGKIYIKTRIGKEKQKSVEISIEDNGPGIPPENVNHIFEPFFTTKEVGAGMGLGLSVAYDIVEKHDGKIHVESRIGEGSRFVITLYADPPNKN